MMSPNTSKTLVTGLFFWPFYYYVQKIKKSIGTLFPLVPNDDQKCYASPKTVSHDGKCTQPLSILSTDGCDHILVGETLVDIRAVC